MTRFPLPFAAVRSPLNHSTLLRPSKTTQQIARLCKPLGAVLLALTFASPAFAAGDIAEGKTLFTSRCSSCHSVGPMASSGFGPQLNAIAGRHAGSLKDFEYSNAMKQSGIVWDDKSLAAFIENPGKLVPGTKMRFWGISNPRKIADLLAYLHTFK